MRSSFPSHVQDEKRLKSKKEESGGQRRMSSGALMAVLLQDILSVVS